LDEKLGKMIPSPERSQTPSLKGSTISSATILSSFTCTISWEKRTNSWFLWTRKKNQAREKGKRQKEKERKNPWSKNEPNNKLLWRNLATVKGKKAQSKPLKEIFHSWYVVLLRLYSPGPRGKKPERNSTLKEIQRKRKQVKLDIGLGFKFPLV